ncbi:hypothetical protein [Vibrio atypicus]|uniref:hypothetical protein n=1 Tax=Vibrio atypicus TaxID=558271 RepID=UPI0013579E35|nr:hypothetical protein [Vibrio atypicus]
MKIKLALLSLAILAGCKSGTSGSDVNTNSKEKSVFKSICTETLDPGEQPLTFFVNGETVDLSGTVCSGSPKAFDDMFTANKNIKLLNFIKIEGSINDHANLILAKKVRNKGLDTLLKSNGYIASGGTDLFVAGVKRTINDGAKIGVHSWATGDGKQATDFPEGHAEHKPYIDFYTEMGLPDPKGFYFFTINAASANSMHYMNQTEIEKYNLGKYNIVPDTNHTDQIDNLMLSQISKAGKVLEENKVWFDYDKYYQDIPKYMVKSDDKGNPHKAFLINPKTTSSDYLLLGNNENHGLESYRNDSNMHLATDKLKPSNGGNTAYDFDYEFDGTKYYLQRYLNGELLYEEKPLPYSISLNVHENFHAYQIENFKFPAGYTQKIDEYPLNEEQIKLKLITQKILFGLPDKTIDKTTLTKKLKQYVALTHRQIELDSTGLVKNMGLGQELFEGGAKYVEVMTVNEIGDFNKKFVFEGYANLPLKTQDDVKWQYAWGIFYDTGAAAIWILDQLGYDLLKLETGITPYAAAVEILDNFDKQTVLDDIYANEGVSHLDAIAQKIANISSRSTYKFAEDDSAKRMEACKDKH